MRLYERVNGKLKPDDIECIIDEAVAEQRLEGIIVTDDEIEKIRDVMYGRITDAEYKAWVLRNAGVLA